MALEKFTVAERLMLNAILLDKASITDLRIIRELRENLSFSEEEHAALDLKPVNGGTSVSINTAALGTVPPKEIEVGPVALGLIKRSLEHASNTAQLTEDCIPLYERFVESKDE